MATVMGPEAKKISDALCSGKDAFFTVEDNSIKGQPGVVFHGEIYPN
jgi:hypothetical protein